MKSLINSFIKGVQLIFIFVILSFHDTLWKINEREIQDLEELELKRIILIK